MKENKIITSLKLFKKAFGPYKYKIILLIFSGFLGGLMEGIGINTIIPLFSFVVKGQDKPTDSISKGIEWVFNFFHIPYSLSYLLVLIALLFVFKAITTFCTNYFTDRVRTDYVKEARKRLLDITLHANWAYLSKQKIGYLEKVLMNDITAYSAMLSYTSSTAILITNVLIYVFVAFNVSPDVTILTVCLGGIFFFIFKPITNRVRIISQSTAIAQKELANHINESMIGIKTIKAMSLEDPVVKKGEDFFEKLRHAEMRLSIYASATYVITQPFSIFIILAVFAYSYKLTTFSFASFAVIVYSINKIFNYVQDGQSRLQNIAGLYPFLRSVLEVEESGIKNKDPYQGSSSPLFNDTIEFKDVNFSYDGKENVLDGINLTIKKGQMVGLIGPSGSGKTTLVDLLLSLMPPSSGEILIDSQSLLEINGKQWRKHIGYVSQDIFIINDTLRNNIRLYDMSITDEEIIEATKAAHIYDFIMNQPNGLDTLAGERGTELSGGQRQRIALARVLARKADILILDEATSALDNESEAAIQKAIEELHGKVTMAIIAHRHSTIAHVDKIVVIKDHKISEEGTPQELLSNEKSYFHKIHHAKS